MLAALALPEVVLLTPLFSTFTRIPDGLFDAARVDGAGVAKAFWYIILPLARPIAAAIVILTLIVARPDRGSPEVIPFHHTGHAPEGEPIA